MYARISPDGTRAALDVRDGAARSLDLGLHARNTHAPDVRPTVKTNSPRGRRRQAYRVLIVTRRRLGRADELVLPVAADGTGSVERLVEAEGSDFSRVLFAGLVKHCGIRRAPGAGENDDIVLVSLSGDGAVAGGNREAKPLLHTMFRRAEPLASLRTVDGWRTNRTSPAAMRFTCVHSLRSMGDAGRCPRAGASNRCGPGTASSCSTGAATRSWRCLSRQSPGFAAGNPTPLFERSICRGPGGRSYDVSPDGQRFLMIKAAPVAGAQGGPPARIHHRGRTGSKSCSDRYRCAQSSHDNCRELSAVRARSQLAKCHENQCVSRGMAAARAVRSTNQWSNRGRRNWMILTGAS